LFVCFLFKARVEEREVEFVEQKDSGWIGRKRRRTRGRSRDGGFGV
jgi:hypothetical protein